MSSYLMVTCAYFALILSGELGDITVLLSLIALIASWFWEMPRVKIDRFAKAWTALTLLVFGFSVVELLVGGDFLLIGARFLLYLLIAKLFNRRRCRDYLQVYVLSFLMLVAATVLNSSFSFGVFFLGYVVSSTWALILFHLRREMEDNFLLKHSDDVSSERVQVARILNSRRIVGKKFFLGTSLVSLTIFFGATLLFLLIPRIGFGLFFSQSRAGVTMTGFSDGVQLGGHGVIKNDDTVVMRVEVDTAYQGRHAPYIHWRGVAFDFYSKGEWRRSRFAPLTQRKVSMTRTDTIHHLLYDQPSLSDAELDARNAAGLRQEIYLEPLGYDVLFGASKPLAYQFQTKIRELARKDRNDEIRHPHTAGIKYVVYSQIGMPDNAELRSADPTVPPGFEPYLQMPPEITQATRDLAREITKGLTNNFERAIAIETWLKTKLGYTLVMKSPGDREPIDFFLFERKKGHCEYFSSAMAVMLRELNMPTRNVNGFLGGEWNEYDQYIAVRAGDAHSWVEVYFGGMGWVTFDPTPSAEIDQMGRGDDGFLDRLSRFADTIRFKWFKWVIEYDLYRQLRLFKKLGKMLRGGAGSFLKNRLTGAQDWIKAHKKGAIGIVFAVAGLIVAITMFRRRKRIQLAGGPVTRSKKPHDPVIALYRAVLARLGKKGHRRPPMRTPREHALYMTEAGVPGAHEFSELTELYYEVEYGDLPGLDEIDRARELRDGIDAAFKAAKRSARR